MWYIYSIVMVTGLKYANWQQAVGTLRDQKLLNSDLSLSVLFTIVAAFGQKRELTYW